MSKQLVLWLPDPVLSVRLQLLDAFDSFHLRLVLGQLVIIVELRHALELSGSTWGQNLMIFWYSLKIVISPLC